MDGAPSGPGSVGPKKVSLLFQFLNPSETFCLYARAVEKWERDEIDRRFAWMERDWRRLEEHGHKTEQRLRELEWRDGMRIHLNITVLFWILLGALVALEIVAAALRA